MLFNFPWNSNNTGAKYYKIRNVPHDLQRTIYEAFDWIFLN